MFKSKKLIYSAAVILATLVTVTFVLASNKKTDTTQTINNVVLTEQTEQKNELAISDQTTSSTSGQETTSSTQSQSLNKKEATVKIITYTIKSGDTLESIANTYGVKINTISQSNNLTTESLLKEGQILEFPSINGVLYKIQNGETLWDLALLNKVDFNKIVEINNLDSPENLKLGQKIIMPDVDKVKSLYSSESASEKKTVTSTKTSSRGGSMSYTISASLPVQGKFSSKFGPRWGRQHAGIDIAAPTGTTVYASMSGKVTFSGWDDGGYGNLVIVDHGNGLQSYYAHNSKLLVKMGQNVSKGTQIANVGSTGNSTGPHSHFEIRKNGTPVNPYNYIK